MTESDARQRLGLRIREARTAAGLSQGQVARLMGLHRPTVSEIEAGSRAVKAEELRQMAKLFDVSTDFLLGATPGSESLLDARVQLAARELKNLSPEALERVLRAIASARKRDPSSEGE